MNSEQFKIVFDDTVKEAERLLIIKGGEYAGNEDRLGNFKRGSSRVGVHPLQILWIYAAKHIDSIETYIRDVAGGVHRERSEPITGRLDDLINYAILAKALILEAGRAEPAVVDHRDGDLDSGRLHRELALDRLHSPSPVAISPPDAQSSSRDDPPVYSRVPDPGVRPTPPVQPSISVAGDLKAGGFRCASCTNRDTPAYAEPCVFCNGGSRYVNRRSQG